jgi:hypothetical protein
MAYFESHWEVEGTDEFAGWFENLKDEEQASMETIAGTRSTYRSRMRSTTSISGN